MVGVLTGRRETVMTGATGAGHLRVVDRVHRRKRIGVVAVLADVGCCNVRRGLASGVGAIVAAAAISGDIHVIEVRRRPAGGRMAVVAVVAAVDMRRSLAGGGNAIVTRTAGPDYLRMVDREYGREDVGCVAVLADIGGLYMRRVLADGLRAVVAACAVACNVDVIEVRR